MTTPAAGSTPGPRSEALARFSAQIAPLDLMPLWERTARMRPGSACVPAMWSYGALRPLLLRSTELITKREAERRVLVLENPSLRGTSFITQSLYAGLQIILPGEIAPPHRHSPSALRFIVEGEGAYTTVEGERIPMSPGDFVVTPNWSWHAHGNEGPGPVVWMDGLDTPFAAFFGAVFREDMPAEGLPPERAAGDSAARFGSGMLPAEYRQIPGGGSPLAIYPYARAREAVLALARGGAPDPAHGHRLRYANPADGGHPFPTLGVELRHLPRGFRGRPYRSTLSMVFNVVEGSGRARFGEQVFSFGRQDILVAPPWTAFALEADEDCVLFGFSDRAAQEALGFFREETDPPGGAPRLPAA